MEKVSQTRISVLKAGVQKPAGAMASAFDVPPMPNSEAAAAKPISARRPIVRGPLVDPAEVEIRLDVPLPPGPGRSTPLQSASQKLLDRLPPGASCVLPTSQAKALIRYARRRDIKLALRGLPDGKSGVWRLKD